VYNSPALPDIPVGGPKKISFVIVLSILSFCVPLPLLTRELAVLLSCLFFSGFPVLASGLNLETGTKLKKEPPWGTEPTDQGERTGPAAFWEATVYTKDPWPASASAIKKP